LQVERTSYGWGVEEGVPASLREAGLTLASRVTPGNADAQTANVSVDFGTSLATDLRCWSAEIRREQAGMRLLGNNFVSLWQYAYKAYPLPTRYHRWRRVRFLMRATVWWHSTIDWLKRCSQEPFRKSIDRSPFNIERIHRPFLHLGLDAHQRLRVSLEHDYLTATRAPHITHELMETGATRIATLSVSNHTWCVNAEAIERFQKEGDWTICIRDADGTRVVSCSFCIASLGGKVGRPQLLIGCIQGPDTATDGRALYQSLTRRWLGLRPKPLVIFLAQSLAQAMGAKTALIVSNEAHVYSSWRYLFRKRRVKADYRSLARDCGAKRSWRKWHVMAMSYCGLSGEASGRNAAQRRRHALLAALDEQIRASVRRKATESGS
jgi:uncharacterized protein